LLRSYNSADELKTAHFSSQIRNGNTATCIGYVRTKICEK